MHRDEETDGRVPGEHPGGAREIDETGCVGVDEDRRAARTHDREGRREGAQRRRQDLVAGLEAERSQADLDGVEPVAASHRVRQSPRGSELGFELANLRTEDEPSALADALHGREGVRARLVPLGDEVIQKDPARVPGRGAHRGSMR